jgi:hypothetical protein
MLTFSDLQRDANVILQHLDLGAMMRDTSNPARSPGRKTFLSNYVH